MIAEELQPGSRVVILAFDSSSDDFSGFIMEELSGALFDRGIDVADRQNLAYVYQELDFRISENLSDENAQAVGSFLGASLVISGELSDHRFRIRIINMEGAALISVLHLDERNDPAMPAAQWARSGAAQQREPQSPGAFLDRGILFASQGDYDMAIVEFSQAIQLNPNFAAAYLHRANVYFDQGDFERAIADYEALLWISNP